MSGRDHLEISARAISVFADDGRLDVDELDELVAIAMRDGVIDEDEKRVLRNIIERLRPEELSQAMRYRIKALRDQFDI